MGWKENYMKHKGIKLSDLEEHSAYDLNNVGFRNVCSCCGRERRPINPNPYDASQWGTRQYCNCR